MKKAMSSETLQLIIAANKLVEQIDINHINDIWINIETKFNKQFKDYLSNLKNLSNWNTNYWNLYSYCKRPDYKPSDGLYNINYIALKYNISMDEATKIVESKKASKATNLDGFIARHGKEKGTELFEQFQKTSVSRSTEQTTDLERRESSVWCKEFYIKRGYDHDEAIHMAKEFNRKNSGANKYYWLGKGFTKTEVDEILSVINTKKKCGINEYIEKYGDNWHIKWEERINKLRSTLNITHDYAEFDNYKSECWKYTNMSIKQHADKIENLHLRGRQYNYQLDHIFSMKMGFICNIDPEIIGHITNLRCITSFDNNSKGDKCDKSINELMEEYNLYESKSNSHN